MGNMKAEVIADVRELSHEQWLDLRSTGIGGSDVAAIYGESPYTSAYTLWLQKSGRVGRDKSSNEAMEWGNLLEGVRMCHGIATVGQSECGRPDHKGKCSTLEVSSTNTGGPCTTAHLPRQRKHWNWRIFPLHNWGRMIGLNPFSCMTCPPKHAMLYRIYHYHRHPAGISFCWLM